MAREHRGKLTVLLALLVVAVGLLTGKIVAERAADSATSKRAAQIEQLLRNATPEEFLAFNAGVRTPGSLAESVRHQDGFVSVQAAASQSFIRFQPSGWWAGFTERCVVAVVHEDGVSVTVPKRACVRVAAPEP